MSTAETPQAGVGTFAEADHEHAIPLGPHEHDHPKDSLYIVIALILAVLTALEVMTYYVDIGKLFLPTLLVLMTVKFLLVVLFFMHVKFDAPAVRAHLLDRPHPGCLRLSGHAGHLPGLLALTAGAAGATAGRPREPSHYRPRS